MATFRHPQYHQPIPVSVEVGEVSITISHGACLMMFNYLFCHGWFKPHRIGVVQRKLPFIWIFPAMFDCQRLVPANDQLITIIKTWFVNHHQAYLTVHKFVLLHLDQLYKLYIINYDYIYIYTSYQLMFYKLLTAAILPPKSLPSKSPSWNSSSSFAANSVRRVHAALCCSWGSHREAVGKNHELYPSNSGW